MDKQQLRIEINHILDSGANEFRLMNLFEIYFKKETKNLEDLISIAFYKAYSLGHIAADVDGGYYSNECFEAFKKEHNL